MIKKTIHRIFLSLIFVPALLCGWIVETEEISDLLSFVNDSTLVLFDLDETLIETAQQLGSHEWQEYIIRKGLAAGFNHHESVKIMCDFYLCAQPYIKMKLVDPSSLAVIEQLKKNCIALVLTSRDPVHGQLTWQQIETVGLCFNEAAFKNRYFAGYEKGIIFSGSNPKGETLKSFLKAYNYFPERIIMVDDHLHKVKSVELAAEELNIDFVGIHYLKAVRGAQLFDPEIVELQWSTLPKYLSDEEARQHLESRKRKERKQDKQDRAG